MISKTFHIKDLDIRIRNISNIRTIATAFNDNIIGLKGYFADYIKGFSDLKKCHYDTLVSVSEFDECCFYTDKLSFRYFIPERELLPKVQPFDYTEFDNIFKILDIVRFRKINRKPTYEYYEYSVPYLGHAMIQENDNSESYSYKINLGGMLFTFEELAKSYELYKDGEWVPFGYSNEVNENNEDNKTDEESDFKKLEKAVWNTKDAEFYEVK